nr:hypothetical protein [Lachnospiraceae bacterium]
TEDFCWYESFEKMVEPYERQIRLLSAVVLNDSSFFYTVNKVALGEPLEPEDEKPCMSSHNTNADDEEGSFMNIPDCDVDCQIPFNWA